jgi:hypothetical protein
MRYRIRNQCVETDDRFYLLWTGSLGCPFAGLGSRWDDGDRSRSAFANSLGFALKNV